MTVDDDLDLERRACLLLAAIYPTRLERVLSGVTLTAYRCPLTYPVGHASEWSMLRLQRRRALRARRTGRSLAPLRRPTVVALLRNLHTDNTKGF